MRLGVAPSTSEVRLLLLDSTHRVVGTAGVPLDASGTTWLDVEARAGSRVLLAFTSLQAHHMTRLVEVQAVGGVLIARAARTMALAAARCLQWARRVLGAASEAELEARAS